MTAALPDNGGSIAPFADLPLCSLLAERDIPTTGALAYRLMLNPRDRGEDFQRTDDLVRHRAALLYGRMHEGRKLGADSPVLLFIAEAGMTARLIGFYRFRARRPGIAPGDIVYDYDAAHLLHSFIARAHHPTFYDAFEMDGLYDLAGRLRLRWPAPAMRSILPASHLGLTVLAG